MKKVLTKMNLDILSLPFSPAFAGIGKGGAMKGFEFIFADEIKDLVLSELKRLAQEYKVDLKSKDLSDEEVLTYTAGGAIIGTLAGVVICGGAGAVAGMLIGGVVGYTYSQVEFTISRRDDGTLVLKI